MSLADTSLALPMLLLMFLTLLVWIFMFIQRVGYSSRNRIDAQQLQTPAQVAAMIPEEASASSYNFKNLLELPVVFYAICLYLMLAAGVDQLHITCAWIFVGGRFLHSLIHCSYNRVMHRFCVYVLSGIALWVMVVRALLAAL